MSTAWTDRVWHEFRAGNLTRAARDVLLTLRTFRGNGGVIVPAHQTLAERTKCGVRTVVRALKQAQLLGLVTWCERRRRAGWRWLRSSNSYRLEMPDNPVQPEMRAPERRPHTNCQGGIEGERQSKKRALEEMVMAATAAPDLLAMRRMAMEKRIAAGINSLRRSTPVHRHFGHA